MTKIVTSENRIIFDGHAKTKDECETISLVCEELTKSDKFKTVKYESGYAEFEKVGKTDILNFPPDGYLEIYSNDGNTLLFSDYAATSNGPWTVTDTGLKSSPGAGLLYTYTGTNTFLGFATSANATEPTYSIDDIFDVSFGVGMLLYIVEGTATSRKSVDLTTLPGWESLSSGSHSITIVAKADGYRDSEPSAAVTVEKAAAMPSKGDLITIEGKQYRVLKTNDTVAEVLCMYDSTASQAFDTSGNSNVYANSSLDVYLSQTFYNSLSTTMQNALVAKTFQQDSWKWDGGTSAIANYAGTYQTTNNYTLSLMSTTFGASISRKCYVLSCQDVIDYLEVTTSMGSADTALTSENVWRMFWNQTMSPGSTYFWLRSAYSGSSSSAFYVDDRSGYLSSSSVDSIRAVRPAFQIDLSKIEWTKQ